jgi:hypothetical protein
MPAEATPFLAAIIQVATKYIKFDPVSTPMPPIICMRLIFIKNYAGGGDDEDEEMLDEDDDDDGDLDEYVNCRAIVSSVVQRLQVVRRRRPIVQNSSLCHETFVLYHRNAARAIGHVIQRGFSGPYLPVRRPRGDCPFGGLGNLRHPLNANSAIWRRTAN